MVRLPKKCPACGSKRFEICGKFGDKVRLACGKCHFESYVRCD